MKSLLIIVLSVCTIAISCSNSSGSSNNPDSSQNSKSSAASTNSSGSDKGTITCSKTAAPDASKAMVPEIYFV